MKSIELFAGAGGLALGLEQAGFEHIALIEKDKKAVETINLNRKNWNIICEDITLIAAKDLEKEFNIKKYELDLLSGGVPCQSFSYAGKKLGIEDTRGTMFYYYAIFLHKLKPKCFLFENVKGMISHNKGDTFKTILNVLTNEGYTISYKVLNAWDYSVPQKRERLFLVGIRNDLVSTVKFEFPEPHKYKPVIRDIKLDSNPSAEECAFYNQTKKELFAMIPPGNYWKALPEDVAKKYMKKCWNAKGGSAGLLRRISLDEPCLTIMTTPSQKITERCHPIEIRPFSYRENARIQTFPESWLFCGSLNDKYKQIGNAVPVNLAKAIGESIYKSLKYNQ